MKIAGWQKLSLLDYPGKMSCIVFTLGCNFRCPFCHNKSLVLPEQATECVTAEEVLDFLVKRRGILEGVVITGGEPLLWPDLEDFLREVRALGYSLKLDSNGSRPQALAQLLEQGLVDYVAMDLKGPPSHYARICGLDQENIFELVAQSLELLRSSDLSFELRSTLVKGLHDFSDMPTMAKIVGKDKYYLQNYRSSEGVIAPQALNSFSAAEMAEFLRLAQLYAPLTQLRS